MRIGIDLLWVRPGKNGGTESYIRNLLDGFLQYVSDQTFVLFVSQDNADSFKKYTSKNFETVICPIKTANYMKRVLWENIRLGSYTRLKNINVWFFPVYSRPFKMGSVRTITVIHDLQALHYPEYFSKVRNEYFRFAWKAACRNSSRIVTISEFCKKDIIENYRISSGKVDVIYNPITTGQQSADFSTVRENYGIEVGAYYYTVCSLAKHKNLLTLLKAMKILKEKGIKDKLVISGVKVNAEGEVFEYINSNKLNDAVVYTGFVSNEIRNSLYDNCKKFLFPSVFEGFGMPPIEALLRGVPVLTTKETSIYEVTEGKAEYVNEPYDENEWAEKIEEKSMSITKEIIDHLSNKYALECITEMYIRTLVYMGGVFSYLVYAYKCSSLIACMTTFNKRGASQ